MTDLTVRTDTQALLDSWLEAERNGERFPVPFDLAWQIAGYSRKDVAKRKLKPAMENKLFHLKVEKTAGRGSEQISLTTDGLKHICLMADTEAGEAVRQYFIEAEKRWKLTQQIAPEVAREVEVLQLQVELATKEAQKMQAERELLAFRHSIVTMCPEPVQQKVLGYTEVKTVEYIDRTITPSGERLDGVGITYIQKRYGFKTTKEAWAWLDSIGMGKDSNRWISEIKPVTAAVLDRECLADLDRIYQSNSKRQMFSGENQ